MPSISHITRVGRREAKSWITSMLPRGSISSSSCSVMAAMRGRMAVMRRASSSVQVMTASTSTLMPEEMTLPRTLSAMKAVFPNNPNGMRTNPARTVSLNSISVMKSWMARMKKESSTSAQAKSMISALAA